MTRIGRTGAAVAPVAAAAALLALSAAPFALAALALPAGLRWACLPFVALASASSLPCRLRPADAASLGLLSLFVAVASSWGDPGGWGAATLCWGVAMAAHAAWSAAGGPTPRRF